MTRQIRAFIIFLTVFVLTLAVSCESENADNFDWPDYDPTPIELEIPGGFPPVIIPPDNPLTKEGINLGRKLYHDKILHIDGLLSCSSCHLQEYGFTSPGTAILPHINLAWSRNFMWDGKFDMINVNLEYVSLFEVEDFMQTNVSRLNEHEHYPGLFYEAFGVKEITSTEIAYALAQFMRTQVSGNSKYDQVLAEGIGTPVFTEQEMWGYELFFSETGDCFHCHGNKLFTDNKFYNIGLDSVFEGVNKGLYSVTGNPADLGKFKVPTLRNAALRNGFMHDGRFKSLREVIEHYNSGVLNSPTLDPVMTKPGKEFGLGLSADEIDALIAFIHTLTDEEFLSREELGPP